MSISLSVLLPVHNAQHRLVDNVAEILDVLPELTLRFEVVIVDDGSLDETAELAYGLEICYPQVSVVRHRVRLGLAQAIQSGLDGSRGEIVFVADEQHGLNPEDLRKLWRMREGYGSGHNTAAAETPEGRTAWVERLLNWRPHGRAAGPQLAGIQVLERKRTNQPTTLRAGLRIDSPAISPRREGGPTRRPSPGPKRKR